MASKPGKSKDSTPVIQGFSNWKPVSTTLVATSGDEDESLPKRVYGTLAECAGRLYLLGGSDKLGRPVDTVYSSDGPLSSWKQNASMSQIKAAVCATTYQDRIVVLGGSTVDQKGTKVVEIYNPSSDTWTKCAEMPGDVVSGMKSVLYNDRLYCIGGIRDADSNCLNIIYVYDINSDRWITQGFPELKYHRYAPSLHLINNRLYIAGGREGKLPCEGNEAYSFDDNSVTKLPCIAQKRVFYSSFQRPQDSCYYLIGGMKYPHETPEIYGTFERFDVVSNAWEPMPEMISPRCDMGTATFGNQLFAIGGLFKNPRNQIEAVNCIEVFAPEELKWFKTKNPMPSPRFAPHVTVYDNKLYVICGFANKDISNAVERLEIKSN